MSNYSFNPIHFKSPIWSSKIRCFSWLASTCKTLNAPVQTSHLPIKSIPELASRLTLTSKMRGLLAGIQDFLVHWAYEEKMLFQHLGLWEVYIFGEYFLVCI